MEESNAAVLGRADHVLWLWEKSHLSGILKVWAAQPSWKGGVTQWEEQIFPRALPISPK